MTHTLWVFVSAKHASPPETLSSLRCVCVCVGGTYSVGLQYELDNVPRVVGQGSNCGSGNQLTVVLKDRETDCHAVDLHSHSQSAVAVTSPIL